jgi:F-type H+-transporting ATPase subunit delta
MSAHVDVYARAITDIIGAEGHGGEAEDELFRFARALEANDELRSALSNRSLPLDRRLAVVDELLATKALTITTAVVTFLVAAGRGNDIPAIVDRAVALGAEARSHEIAEVRSAIALSEGQVRDLTAALARATGKQVEVKVVVDESVLGGLVARVGDTVIDGTVRHRLDQLKESI